MADNEKGKAYTFLQPLIKEVRAKTFSWEAPDATVLGIILARYFEWDGLEVLKAASSALQESNYHPEDAQIREMIEKLEKEF